MSNWHIKIADCNEAQKERLKQVYGYGGEVHRYFGFDSGGVSFVGYQDTRGELITPDEAFERLGLDVNYTANKLIEANEALCEKIKELEQQLAAKPELQGIDWSIIELEYNWLAQNKGSGTIDFYRVKPTDSNYAILATRPKPKYTKEQIEAAKAYDEWLDLNNGDFESDCFEAWLKEVGNEA